MAVTCYDLLIKNSTLEVSKWLELIEFDKTRLDCIKADPIGQFYRKKTLNYTHLYKEDEADTVHYYIRKVSEMFRNNNLLDCTQYFEYDSCC
jgi:hypothetical protein